MLFKPDHADCPPQSRLWAIIRQHKIICGLLLLLALAVSMQSENVYHDEWSIDIHTGRIRDTTYLFNMPTFRSTKDSSISLLLNRQNIENETPDWHPCFGTFGGFLPHSSKGHYDCTYGAAPSQLHEIDELWNSAPFTDDAKKQIALTVLKDWQTTGDCTSVQKYLDNVFNLVLDNP